MGKRNETDISKMSAVFVIKDRIEITVRDVDIQREDTGGFEKKFQTALLSRPRKLVVRLQARVLSTGALGVILRARAEAKREGVEFVLEPDSNDVAEMVRSLGVDQILGMAA